MAGPGNGYDLESGLPACGTSVATDGADRLLHTLGGKMGLVLNAESCVIFGAS